MDMQGRLRNAFKRVLRSHETLHPKVADSKGEIIVDSLDTDRTNNSLSHVTTKSVIARKNIGYSNVSMQRLIFFVLSFGSIIHIKIKQ